MTALVFLWALVGTLVRVAPVPLSIFLVSPLLLRAPPVFVTLVLLWAFRLVPVNNLLNNSHRQSITIEMVLIEYCDIINVINWNKQKSVELCPTSRECAIAF